MADDKWQTFAPVPARAMADRKLTAEHYRVLMTIAAHDRFGANGRACYASHPRLATLAKCHLKSLSRSLRVLAERGYIEVAPNPLNQCQRAYRVVYLPEDKAIMKQAIGNGPVTEDELIEEPTGNELVPDGDPIGNKDFYEPEQNQGVPEHKIYCETVRISRETVKDNSAEAEDAGERRKEASVRACEALIDDDEEADDAFEERTAILEYDAGFTRAEAERRARNEQHNGGNAA